MNATQHNCNDTIAMNLWNTISKLPGCERVAPLGSREANMFLLRIASDKSSWLIAPYASLTVFATALRERADLRDFLTSNRVRIGLRETDKPPADMERQKSFGATVAGPKADLSHVAERTNPQALPVNPGAAQSMNRRTDREANVHGYWQTQTPQSHHIVEYNNLAKLGVSREGKAKEMDYDRLPAVLLAAEFHQKYISMILKPPQRWPQDDLRRGISMLYRRLYEQRSELFKPLWKVSEAILAEGGLLV
jgi:hypothetical protein